MSGQRSPVPEGERQLAFENGKVTVEPTHLNIKQRRKPNWISTTKFTPLTWLPLSLFYQFQRVANIYFLFVAIVVVCLGKKSPKNWKSKVFPFIGVLLWTALKDAYEDYGRRRDDEEENRRKCQRYDSAKNAFVEIEWQDVLVGDILFLAIGDAFPADLMLLQVTGGNEAFISTVNLDGESNLKERRPPALCNKICKMAPTECVASSSSGSDKARGQLSSSSSSSDKASRVQPPAPSRVQPPARAPPQLSLPSKGSSVAPWQAEAQEAAKNLVNGRVILQMGKPEPALSEVRGKLVSQVEECAASDMHFLPRGCVLRNTLWVLAVVAYVGDETKTKLNAVKCSQKTSNMQRYLNRCVQGLLAALAMVVMTCSIMAKVLKSDDDDWFTKFLKYCVTFYHVVPISLYVMFEMLKLVLGYQVNTDQQMIDPETKKGAVARTADLMEELGQVDFLFSDKTGTLTANEMIFARCCVQGKDPGDFRSSAMSQEGAIEVRRILATPRDPLHEAVKMFFTCLAICHSVHVEERKPKGIVAGAASSQRFIFTGMSPDEVALVQGAYDVGIALEKRARNPSTFVPELTVMGPTPQDVREFQVLHELQFNSDRKRMSVVIKHKEEVWCVTKGADNVMASLLEDHHHSDHGDETKDCLRRFSEQGLRTLVVAMKRVKPAYLQQWEAELHAAENIMDSSRNERVAEVHARMETKLTLVGLTAVEDRLQDGVPQAIQTVKDAGVRVWVLTGDKTETAVDIAMSCALFGPMTKLAYATEAESGPGAVQLLRKAREDLQKTDDAGFVLDGRTVGYALEHPEACSLIYELGLASRSCVCCRLSPMQKRLLVELVRQKNSTTITMAIGDGANDVPMLEAAHIGIGVCGKEGAQAVQACNIAISQFRFLVPLLLCHGRRSYRRVAIFLCYYLYKNVTLVVSDIVWSIQDNFQGRIAYPEYLSLGFNALFTSWHILFVLGFDNGVSDSVANEHPELYHEGPRRELFNPGVFAIWMGYAVWHGCFVWLIPNIAWGGTEYTETPSAFWRASCTSFLITVFVVNVRLLLCCLNPFNLPAMASTLCSFMLTLAVLFLLGETKIGYGMSGNEKMEGIPSQIFSSGQVWLALVFVPFFALSVDCIFKLIQRCLFPTAMDKLLWDMHYGGKREQPLAIVVTAAKDGSRVPTPF